MPYQAFKSYIGDVLARLVKVCAQKHQPVGRALKIMRWAEQKRDSIKDAWREHVAVDDAAADLYELAIDRE